MGKKDRWEKRENGKKEEGQRKDIPTENLDDYNVSKTPIGLETDGRR